MQHDSDYIIGSSTLAIASYATAVQPILSSVASIGSIVLIVLGILNHWRKWKREKQK
jgi:uncharacterized membrane protein